MCRIYKPDGGDDNKAMGMRAASNEIGHGGNSHRIVFD